MPLIFHRAGHTGKGLRPQARLGAHVPGRVRGGRRRVGGSRGPIQWKKVLHGSNETPFSFYETYQRKMPVLELFFVQLGNLK